MFVNKWNEDSKEGREFDFNDYCAWISNSSGLAWSALSFVSCCCFLEPLRKQKSVTSSLIAYNLRFFILLTTLSSTLHKRTHGINQHTKPIIEFSEIPNEARCRQWGPTDIQVFMNFFIIHQSQGTLPTCIVLMPKIAVKRNKMFCLSFCALSFTSFHIFRVPTLQWALYFCTRKRACSRPHKSYGISKWPIPLTIGIIWKSLGYPALPRVHAKKDVLWP